MNIGDLGFERLQKPLYEETEIVIQPYLKLWAIQLRDWLRQASQAVNQLEEVKKQLNKTKYAKINLENFQNTFILSTTRTQYINEDAQRIIIDGYKLLNTIGETFRNEQINYKITIITKGNKLSEAALDPDANIYTFVVPMEKFLKFANTTVWNSALQSSGPIYKALQKKHYLGSQGNLLKRAEDIALEKWDEERKKSYLLFHDQATHAIVLNGRNREQPWLNVNEGQTLEAFFRFTSGGRIAQYSKDKQYWKNIKAVMKATMSNPDIFVKGGDIANEQIKGINASITNLGTLINVSTTILNSLILNKEVFNEISSSLKPSIKTDLETCSTKTIQEVVQSLKEILVSSVNRDFNMVIEI